MDDNEAMLGQLLAGVLHDMGYADRANAEFERLRSREARLVAAAERLIALLRDRFDVESAPGDAFWRGIREVEEAIAVAEPTASASP